MREIKKRLVWVLVLSLVVPMCGTGRPDAVFSENVGRWSEVSAAQVETSMVESPEITDVWDGTVDTSWYVEGQTTFEIGTAGQLAGLSKLVNEGKVQENSTIYLTQDIYLNEKWETYASWGEEGPANVWTPIGTEEVPFVGDFYGNGHSIYGMYVKEGADTGLLGVAKGQIENIYVMNSYINGTKSAGAIVGTMTDGRLYNCGSETVVCGDVAGGIVGTMIGDGTVERCYNAGDVRGVSYAGGVMGKSEEGMMVVSTCYQGGTVHGDTYSGGIMGGITCGDEQCFTWLGNLLVYGEVSTSSGYAGAYAGQLLNYQADCPEDFMNYCYYLSTSETNPDVTAIGCDESDVEYKDTMGMTGENEFSSGYIAYMMRDAGYGQKLGVNPYPVLGNDNNSVYHVEYSAEVDFGNGGVADSIYQEFYKNKGDKLEDWSYHDEAGNFFLDGWYTNDSYRGKWDFETMTVTKDQSLSGRLLLNPLPSEIPQGAVYEITTDMMADIPQNADIRNRVEVSTDEEGVPCIKVEYAENYEHLYFELSEVVDLSAYDRLEFVADVPKQIVFKTYDTELGSNSQPKYPYYNGSYIRHEDEPMVHPTSGEQGKETYMYRWFPDTDVTQTKYVSVGANTPQDEEFESGNEYRIYAIRFIDLDYEEGVVVATPTPPVVTQEPGVLTPLVTETPAPPLVTVPPTVNGSDTSVQNTPTTPSNTLPPSASPDVKKTSKKKAKKREKLKKPVIRLSKGRTSLGGKCVKVKVKKYKGTHVQIYIRQKKKGRFVRIKLKKSSIKKNKGLFKLSYSKGGTMLYCKVRTYKKEKGKKQYSKFSKIKKIRL